MPNKSPNTLRQQIDPRLLNTAITSLKKFSIDFKILPEFQALAESLFPEFLSHVSSDIKKGIFSCLLASYNTLGFFDYRIQPLLDALKITRYSAMRGYQDFLPYFIPKFNLKLSEKPSQALLDNFTEFFSLSFAHFQNQQSLYENAKIILISILLQNKLVTNRIFLVIVYTLASSTQKNQSFPNYDGRYSSVHFKTYLSDLKENSKKPQNSILKSPENLIKNPIERFHEKQQLIFSTLDSNNCRTCNKIYEISTGYRQYYCSPQCHQKSRENYKYKQYICAQLECNKKFIPKIKTQKYCSRKCYYLARVKISSRTCLVCSQQYSVYENSQNTISDFCSLKCKKKSHTIPIAQKCARCHESFPTTLFKREKYCKVCEKIIFPGKGSKIQKTFYTKSSTSITDQQAQKIVALSPTLNFFSNILQNNDLEDYLDIGIMKLTEIYQKMKEKNLFRKKETTSALALYLATSANDDEQSLTQEEVSKLFGISIPSIINLRKKLRI